MAVAVPSRLRELRETGRPRTARARAFLASPPGLLTVLVAIGVALRLFRFSAPILDQHMFRQTQTASTVWLWDRYGFDALDYRVPMFGGGHWVLELPVYQALVWAMALPFGGIEPMGRVVSIASYVAVAVLMYLIGKRLFGSRAVALLGVALFTFLPVTVFYYRAILIDPLLIAATLLTIYAAMRLAERFSWAWTAVFSVALVVSVLGKATLMLAVGLPVLVLGWRILADRRTPRAGRATLLGVGALTLVLSFLWTRHGDGLNVESGALAISNGGDWYFGTTFRDAETFRIVGQRFLDNFGPVGLVLVAMGIAAIPSVRTRYRPEIVAMLAGSFLSVGIFANLNRVHDYYQLVYYVPLSMMAGLGLGRIHQALARLSPTLARQTAVGVVVGLAALWSLVTWSSYFAPQAVAYSVLGQGIEVRDNTPDARILVLGEGFSPNEPMLFYEARRIGWRAPVEDRAGAEARMTTGDLGAVVMIKGPAGVPPWLGRAAVARGFRLTHDSLAMTVWTRSGGAVTPAV